MAMDRSMLGPAIPDRAKETIKDKSDAELTPEEQAERHKQLASTIEDRWEEYGEPNRPVGAE